MDIKEHIFENIYSRISFEDTICLLRILLQGPNVDFQKYLSNIEKKKSFWTQNLFVNFFSNLETLISKNC